MRVTDFGPIGLFEAEFAPLGLQLILGGRASGKTHLLGAIAQVVFGPAVSVWKADSTRVGPPATIEAECTSRSSSETTVVRISADGSAEYDRRCTWTTPVGQSRPSFLFGSEGLLGERAADRIDVLALERPDWGDDERSYVRERLKHVAKTPSAGWGFSDIGALAVARECLSGARGVPLVIGDELYGRLDTWSRAFVLRALLDHSKRRQIIWIALGSPDCASLRDSATTVLDYSAGATMDWAPPLGAAEEPDKLQTRPVSLGERRLEDRLADQVRTTSTWW